jgi:two-component system, NarL family, sensor kinase
MKKQKYFFAFSLYLIVQSVFLYSQNSTANDTLTIRKYLDDGQRLINQYPDSAYIVFDKAIKLSTKIKSNRFISISKQLMSYYYNSKEDYGTAMQYLLEALKIEESRNNKYRIADIYDDLGYIYMIMEKFNKSMNYYTDALHIYEKLKDTFQIAKSYAYIGGLHCSREFCENRTIPEKKEDYTIALNYYQKAVSLFQLINSDEGLFSAYVNIANLYNKLEKPNDAIPYLQKCVEISKNEDNTENLISIYLVFGGTYTRLKFYDKAISYYNQAIDLSRKHNLTEGIQYLYEELAHTYDEAGDYKNAYDNYINYMILRDSIYNADKSKQVFELETRYQSEKKEKEILALSLEKKKKNLTICILSSAFLLLLLIGIIIFRSLRSKKIIAEQSTQIKEHEISELKKHQQLLATQSVLSGEENERRRLARELHDGLGGLLSGVKLKLTSLKGNFMINDESAQEYKLAVDTLDNSVQELRRVAHNMMPETLVKFGLKEAINDFCSSITSKSCSITFQFYGNVNRVGQNLEISCYRIVQELVNNALKHAGANKIVVQLVQEDARINLTVQDNGKGFDMDAIDLSKGAGLNNVRSRVDSLKGVFDIHSQIGLGTEITVEFKI